MSRKNSASEKAKRRALRAQKKENFRQPHFYLVPMPGEEGYRRIHGQCQGCLLMQEMIKLGFTLMMPHPCKEEFLTEEQVEDIEEAAYQLAKKFEEEEAVELHQGE